MLVGLADQRLVELCYCFGEHFDRIPSETIVFIASTLQIMYEKSAFSRIAVDLHTLSIINYLKQHRYSPLCGFVPVHSIQGLVVCSVSLLLALRLPLKEDHLEFDVANGQTFMGNRTTINRSSRRRL